MFASTAPGLRFFVLLLSQAADPQQLPPLAVLHQQQEPCAGLSDTYWVSSFAKKQLYDHPGDNDTCVARTAFPSCLPCPP